MEDIRQVRFALRPAGDIQMSVVIEFDTCIWEEAQLYR